MARSNVWDKARLQSASAPHSGCWLDAPPGLSRETQLSNGEVQHGVARRLGVPVCDEHACPFCLGVVDKWAAHCESCMGGGDKTVNHNEVRDDIYAQAKRSHLAPQLEAMGVSSLLGLEQARDTRERPADVLLCRAQDIIVGTGGGAGRVALDIGIICPQATCHLENAAQEKVGAAEAYARTKCARAGVSQRCRDAGVVFQPLIFESLGGVSLEADRVIKSMNRAVAANTDSPLGEVATRFWNKISVDIVRGSHRAFKRRTSNTGVSLGPSNPFRHLSGLQQA